MKEAIVSPDLAVEIIDSPIPTPGDNDVLIKVVVSGSNPKDWKVPMWRNTTSNSGDGKFLACPPEHIAGTVEKAGKAVAHIFHKGQRVAAFHRMMTPNGSFAEYAIAPAHTTIAIPESTTYEEAAAVPLAALTAALGLFVRLGLPEPWCLGGSDGKREKPVGPLIVYGGATAVGAYAIQLAKRSHIGPLYVVAGRGIPFVEKLLDKAAGDVIIDYRQGDDAVVEGLKKAAGGQKLLYAFDAVSEKGSYVNTGKVLSEGAKMTMVLPVKEDVGVPEHVEKTLTMVGDVHDGQTDFGQASFQLIGKGLQEGWFKAHPTEVIPGGLNGVQTGLENLKSGKASANKYVFRIADTPGLSK